MSRSSPARVRSSRAFTRIELLAVLGIIGIVALTLLPDQNTQVRWNIEQRTREWQQNPPAIAKPQQVLLATDIALEGKWAVRRHRQSSGLELVRQPSGQWNVKFDTGGCVGQCMLERTARFRNGVLTFDQPVSEYMPVTYDRLYAIQIDGADYLLPAALVEQFERDLSAEPKPTAESPAVRFCLFRREPQN